MEQRIVCSAIQNQEGEIICSPRHFDTIMNRQIRNSYNPQKWVKSEQGFLDQFGNFLTRKRAFEIALKNGQILRRVSGDEEKLFSENLY